MFQPSNFYDRCYCNSDVFWLQGRAYNVIHLMADELASTKGAWLGGVFLAGGVVVIYVGFVELFSDPPLPDALSPIAFLVSWDVVAALLPSFILYRKLYL